MATNANSRIRKQDLNNRNLFESQSSPTNNELAEVNLNIKKDPTDTKTTIQFLLSTLANKLNVRPNQALALLSNSNALLAHVIIRGLKGNYLLVVDWYKELFLHCKFLVKLFANESEGMTSALHVLDIVKAGLYSKCLEVSNWTLRLLGKIATEMNEAEMSGIAWVWFVAENGGLQAILSMIEISKELINENLVSVLCQFGRYNFMKLAIPTTYITLLTQMLEPLKDYKVSRDELISKGVVSFWLDFACRKADVVNPDINERMNSLVFLMELWLNFPTVIEESDEYSDLIVKLLQRASRDKVSNLQIVSVALLFKLLEHSAEERSPYALPLYKSLTFALVENHQKIELREFILMNFKSIFESLPTIPVSILLEPFIKQIHTSDGVTFAFNLFDFDFFNCVARHPKLKAKNGIQILDLLTRAYLYNQIFSDCILYSYATILERFKTSPLFSSFMSNLIKVLLNQ